uniref:Uncharacterized protein n=1 Tax=Romanomermis culicivorax TaxID=13658 RepID=A0A915KD76_ROMCU
MRTDERHFTLGGKMSLKANFNASKSRDVTLNSGSLTGVLAACWLNPSTNFFMLSHNSLDKCRRKWSSKTSFWRLIVDV